MLAQFPVLVHISSEFQFCLYLDGNLDAVAAKLESLELAIDGAPGDHRSLATPHLARNDAVPLEPLPRDHLGPHRFVDLRTEHATHSHERPRSRRDGGVEGAAPFVSVVHGLIQHLSKV